MFLLTKNPCYPPPAVLPKTPGMKGLGQRLRERARELGLADATIAERLGLSQQRYHNYISDQTEPDFQTLVRICRALATEPNAVLGFAKPGTEGDGDERSALQSRISAAIVTMDSPTLRVTAAVVDTLARRPEAGSTLTVSNKPVTKRGRSRRIKIKPSGVNS